VFAVDLWIPYIIYLTIGFISNHNDDTIIVSTEDLKVFNLISTETTKNYDNNLYFRSRNGCNDETD